MVQVKMTHDDKVKVVVNSDMEEFDITTTFCRSVLRQGVHC